MRYGYDELDVPRTLTAHFLFRNLYSTTVADNALIPYSLIFTASTFIILCRAEDTLAEKAIALGLVRTVVYCLRLGHLAIRIFEDFLRRRKTDGYLRKITLYL